MFLTGIYQFTYCRILISSVLVVLSRVCCLWIMGVILTFPVLPVDFLMSFCNLFNLSFKKKSVSSISKLIILNDH